MPGLGGENTKLTKIGYALLAIATLLNSITLCWIIYTQILV